MSGDPLKDEINKTREIALTRRTRPRAEISNVCGNTYRVSLVVRESVSVFSLGDAFFIVNDPEIRARHPNDYNPRKHNPLISVSRDKIRLAMQFIKKNLYYLADYICIKKKKNCKCIYYTIHSLGKALQKILGHVGP